jgi:hypothetical protein
VYTVSAISVGPRGITMADYKYNHEIHTHAKKILEKRRYKADCLEAGVCPKCDSRLDSETDDHGFTEMTCTGCHTVYYM